METAQIPIGATIMVPTDNSGYEPMVVVNSVGFGANAKVEAHPLASGGWSRPSARSLEPEEIAGALETEQLALDGTPDMVKIAKLNEASLLHCLRVRYARDEIYTRVGSILISVNPFKQLNIYGSERMAQAVVRARTIKKFPLLCSLSLTFTRACPARFYFSAESGREDPRLHGAPRLRPRRGGLPRHAK